MEPTLFIGYVSHQTRRKAYKVVEISGPKSVRNLFFRRTSTGRIGQTNQCPFRKKRRSYTEDSAVTNTGNYCSLVNNACILRSLVSFAVKVHCWNCIVVSLLPTHLTFSIPALCPSLSVQADSDGTTFSTSVTWLLQLNPSSLPVRRLWLVQSWSEQLLKIGSAGLLTLDQTSKVSFLQK